MHSEMIKLYNNVIEDFISLLEKQYRNKDPLTSDEIDKMKKILKAKMKNPQLYTKQVINNFFDKAISHMNQPKMPLETKKDNDTTLKIQQQAILQSAINRNKSNQEEQEDDLNQFKKNKNSKFSQKDVQKQNLESVKFNESDLQEFDLNDDDSKLGIKELNTIRQNTGLHILGAYNTREKKFNSKKQQTRLTIYNAFLKIEGHDHQILFPVVELVASRVSKSKLNI